MARPLHDREENRASKLSWTRRLSSVAVVALRGLAPGLAIPGYCRFCGDRLVLVEDRQTVEDLRCLQGVRLWRCPHCQDLSFESYACPQYHD